MQSLLLSCLLSQTAIIFSDYPVNIWVASFMVYVFHGSTILQSGVYLIHEEVKGSSLCLGLEPISPERILVSSA